MRKQIDIPDEHVPNLRVIAAIDGTNVKKWIENLVLSTVHQRVKKKKFFEKMISKI
jgi:hypothetical protein